MTSTQKRLGPWGALALALVVIQWIGCSAGPDTPAGPGAGASGISGGPSSGGDGGDASQADSGVGAAGGDSAGGANGESGAGAGGGSGSSSSGAAGGGAGGAGGGTAGSAATAGAGGSMQNPCAGIPDQGRCIANNQVQSCAVPTGDGTPVVVTEQCDATSVCQVVAGRAACVPRAGGCVSGTTRCLNAGTRETCVAGTWVDETCDAGCRMTALGAFCSDDTPTVGYAGTLQYEARGPNANFSDWTAAPSVVPAQGVLVESVRGSSFVDATVTDENGGYSLQIPTPAQAGDRVLFVLVHPNALATGFSFAVAQPDLPDGEQPIEAAPGPSPQIWLWQLDLQTSPSGSTAVITEALGSGAMRIYDNLRAAYIGIADFYSRPGETLVAWLRMNTAWSCGSCFYPVPANVGTLSFDSQMFFPALAENTSYWADSVSVHELGHWAMQSYGLSPREGGGHCLGVATLPGQAWSEGWATGFSSIARDSPVYYDKQQGTMFWIDLNAHLYSSTTWSEPIPSAGLLQAIDENDVAAMLWGLAVQPSIGGAAVLDALPSTRLTETPFARGYTRHTWTVNNCTRENEADTGVSAPMFADFLDALRCGGATPAAVDEVTQPATAYPYPSMSPICQ